MKCDGEEKKNRKKIGTEKTQQMAAVPSTDNKPKTKQNGTKKIYIYM